MPRPIADARSSTSGWRIAPSCCLLLQQHVLLVLVSTARGGCARHSGRHLSPRGGRAPAARSWPLANIAQTMPSLALLGFLLPLPFIGGIGPRTALVALSLYALLPIVRNTVTGLQNVDARSSKPASRWG